MLTIAAHLDLELSKMDVDTAYLYGELGEEIYLRQPMGYRVKGKDGRELVFCLKKAIYGLKQPGRC